MLEKQIARVDRLLRRRWQKMGGEAAILFPSRCGERDPPARIPSARISNVISNQQSRAAAWGSQNDGVRNTPLDSSHGKRSQPQSISARSLPPSTFPRQSNTTCFHRPTLHPPHASPTLPLDPLPRRPPPLRMSARVVIPALVPIQLCHRSAARRRLYAARQGRQGRQEECRLLALPLPWRPHGFRRSGPHDHLAGSPHRRARQGWRPEHAPLRSPRDPSRRTRLPQLHRSPRQAREKQTTALQLRPLRGELARRSPRLDRGQRRLRRRDQGRSSSRQSDPRQVRRHRRTHRHHEASRCIRLCERSESSVQRRAHGHASHRAVERVVNFDSAVRNMPKALNKPAQGCRACEATQVSSIPSRPSARPMAERFS